MDIIKDKIALLVSDYLTLYTIGAIAVIGIGLVLLSIFIPKKIGFQKIDLKRLIKKEDTNMNKIARYLHILSKESLFKYVNLDEDSAEYKKYEKQIEDAGGLQGLTPEALYVLKLIGLGVGLFLLLLLSFIVVDTGLGIHLAMGIIPFAMFMAPNAALKIIIKNRQADFLRELETIELFTVVYLNAGYNVYDLLVALKDITVVSNKYISECVNEYYINPEVALQHLADKIGLEEYQLLINILKQSIKVSGDKITDFVKGHLKQLKKVETLAVGTQNKKRPLKYAFILGLPLIGIVILWFYPLLVDAMEVFTQLGTF